MRPINLILVFFILIVSSCDKKNVPLNKNERQVVDTNYNSVNKIAAAIQDKKNQYLTLNNQSIGLWEIGEEDFILRIRKDKKLGYIGEVVSPSDPAPCNSPTLLKKKKLRGKIEFIDIESPEQYYVFENDGNLSVYDDQGFIVTYNRIK